jgi:hypothetical protein
MNKELHEAATEHTEKSNRLKPPILVKLGLIDEFGGFCMKFIRFMDDADKRILGFSSHT